MFIFQSDSREAEIETDITIDKTVETIQPNLVNIDFSVNSRR